MKRHCGCRYWRLGPLVLFWPCGLFVLCLTDNVLDQHEDFARSCRDHMPLKGAILR